MEIRGNISQKRPRRRSYALSRFQEKWTLGGLHSEKKFLAIVGREYARADRHGSIFSLIIFYVGDKGEDRTVTHQLVEALNYRVRLIDEVGWLDTRRMGVVLPGTQAEGAQKFADDICRRISNGKLPPFFKIYSYPSEESLESKDKVEDHSPPKSENDRETPLAELSDKAQMCRCRSSGGRLDPFMGRGIPFWKRGIDILGSIFGLVLLFPLLLIVAMLIKVVSPGPVFYMQERVGYLGKSFKCWKFRTMRADSSTSVHKNHVIELIKKGIPYSKMDDYDDRIIPFGKLLRITGIDELPQLFNVLRGEMSLVGPRPELPYSLRCYDQWQTRRFHVIPGLTGLWQINGKNTTTFKRMIRWDISYIQRRSFWLDLKILLKTPTAIARQAFNYHFKKEGKDAGE